MFITTQTIKLIILAVLLVLLATACTNSENEQPQTTGADVAGQPVTSLGASPPISDATTAVSNPAAQNTEITNEAVINSVDTLILESFPVQVTAVIKGSLPNNCTTIGQVTQTRNGNEFVVAVGTLRQTDAMCTEQVEPFEQNVSLDVLGLPAGSYSVVVTGTNSASNFFALDVDNIPPQGAPSPELVGASITGIVWQDTCSLLDDGSPSAGCVQDENGNYRGNAVFDSSEARIAGVEVTLRSGDCSSESEMIGLANTDSAGNYVLTSLRAGTYCVGINPTSQTNAPILMPGQWTYPGVEVGSSTTLLEENGYQTIDFGWDYEVDPPPSVTAPPATAPDNEGQNCTDVAAFVSDVTIPDGTLLAPGEAFVKTWRVSNQGSCTWDSGYSLVFAGGEQMSGPASVPLGQAVQPGGEIDVSVSLVAPLTPDGYAGDWMFQNPDGTTFGSQGDYPIYLQIVVSE